MNNLEFRAWLKKEKAYAHRINNIDFLNKELYCLDEDDCGLYPSFDDCVIEQYTGLKDKNGKKIYEGDIVRIAQLAWYREIIWFNNGWKTKAIPEPRIRRYLEQHPDEEREKEYIEEIMWIRQNETHYDLLDSEVVGNIHENPELLGKEKEHENT